MNINVLLLKRVTWIGITWEMRIFKYFRQTLGGKLLHTFCDPWEHLVRWPPILPSLSVDIKQDVVPGTEPPTVSRQTEAMGTEAEISTRSQTGILRQIFVLPSSLQKALIQ